ncbi:MAG TPA: glycosyltransferase N-terminal domain-containing protein [Candidatus Methanoperedens sp.]|nr:glycosyltransferase N-terminal domain-containing protein [Candidatus Methanoperedens sp.]
MLLIIYQVVGAAALAVLALAAPFVPALRRGLGERFGAAPAGEPARGSGPPGAETIWVHAASVGEVGAAAPLVEALLRERPAARVLVSTFTAAGRAAAERSIAAGDPRVRCLFAPLDWGWIPRAVVRRERPALFILLETELWPVLLLALRRAGVPVLVANGRISSRRFGRYRALRRALRPALEAVSLALACTAEDAQRYVALGLPAARVRVAGNLKHARPPREDRAGVLRRERIREFLGVGSGRRALVGGSVRGAEAGMLLGVFRELRAADPGLLLVLAPRHPDRFDAAVLGPWDGAWVRWSAMAARIPPETAVVLVDTVGELADCYAAATIACVGGTWGDHGGHNLLEPAFHGVPVVFGPDFRHFAEEGRALLASGGGFVTDGAEGVRERCRRLLADPALCAEAGRCAAQTAMSFGDALAASLAAARALLANAAGGRRG